MSDTVSPSAVPDEVRERYAQERAKRVRDEGIDQFKEFTGDYADFDRDPYADPDFRRDPVIAETGVIIIGAGFGGMMTAVNLTKLGLRDFRIIEKAGDFGGTWYWNRYPGCMCDVESYTYMPFLEETGYMPTSKYASAPEIFEHCQRIGKHFDLYPHALFQTRIGDVIWDDDDQRWTVTTDRGDQLTARFVVSAAGLLHKAKLPGIAGINDYAGHRFHTGRWDYDYTGGSPTEPMDKLSDKRVGIIGTGATSIQAVPNLAAAAKEVFVFQRTPAAVGVRGNGPTDAEWFKSLEPGWQAERIENFTACVSGDQPNERMVDDGWVQAMWVDTQMRSGDPDESAALDLADFEIMDGFRKRIDEVIDDPELAEKLKPWWSKHCKRLTFHDEYLASFNQPNVHLIDTDGQGVERINADGVIVGDTTYPLDLLIFASGYEVTTGFVRRIGFDPKGRGGVPLSEHWDNGAHTLHGIHAAEFPNFLVISTMQASYGVNFAHFLAKSTEHIAWVINEAFEQGITSIEPTPEAEDEWLMTLFGLAAPMAEYTSICTPSYYNSEASEFSEERARNVVHPGNLAGYAAFLERWREAGDFPGTVIRREGDS